MVGVAFVIIIGVIVGTVWYVKVKNNTSKAVADRGQTGFENPVSLSFGSAYTPDDPPCFFPL